MEWNPFWRSIVSGSIHIWRQMFFWYFWPNQMVYYYISLFGKIRCSLTYLPTQKSDIIYECSLGGCRVLKTSIQNESRMNFDYFWAKATKKHKYSIDFSINHTISNLKVPWFLVHKHVRGTTPSLASQLVMTQGQPRPNSDEVITFVCVYEDSKYRQMALIGFCT